VRDPLLQELLNIALAASEEILRVYDQGFEVHFKGEDDPVTTADRAANTLICNALSQRFPNVPIVAEESEPESYEAFAKADRAFFVDPIDGTREFIARTDEFVVMIGLAERGVAHSGVVYAPARHRGWFGSPTQGATTIENGAERAIQPSNTTELADALLVASRFHEEADVERVVKALGIGRSQAVGSAGLKGALVAEGSADLYISPGRAGKRWDACAIDALLRAAGGTLTDTRGRVLDYQRVDLNNEAGLLATNSVLLSPVLQELERFRAARST
jgi:3'(2'), 5'-bisphosphate nucleotidase